MKAVHVRSPELVGFTDFLKTELAALPGVVEVFLGGSFCRGKPEIGDLDFAVCVESEKEHSVWVYDWFLSQSIPGAKFVGGPGGVQFRSTLGYNAPEFSPIQVDIWLAEPQFWGVMCMFVAGSNHLNILQRTQASRKGFNLSQRGLSKGGAAIPTHTEQEVYQILGMPWLSYEQRNFQFRS